MDGNFPFFIKSIWETDENFPIIDKFCWSVRDRIADLVNTKSKAKAASNLSIAEKTALKKLITTKNKKLVISNTDKNVGPSISDKEDVISECKRQLSDTTVYKKLSNRLMFHMQLTSHIGKFQKKLYFNTTNKKRISKLIKMMGDIKLKIRHAKRGNEKTLDLSGFGILELPADIT